MLTKQVERATNQHRLATKEVCPNQVLTQFKIRWQVFIPLFFVHTGALFAPLHFTWNALLWTLFLWFATGMWGITVGYHRLLAHRAFETTPMVKAFHLFWSAISLQQGPISWTRLHRAHHKYSDTDADPHSQNHGFFYGHIGWTFLAHQRIGRSPELRKVPPDLAKDPLIVFFEKIHYPMFILSIVFFYLAGGWPLLLWAGCVRTVLVLHFTWMVNSLTHRWGYRNFDSKDQSTNNWLVALLTWGEGWHNNHHAFPGSARQGLRWWEIDLSWQWIKLLNIFGLCWRIQSPRHLSSVTPEDKPIEQMLL